MIEFHICRFISFILSEMLLGQPVAPVQRTESGGVKEPKSGRGFAPHF